jgi:hypothetical protein
MYLYIWVILFLTRPLRIKSRKRTCGSVYVSTKDAAQVGQRRDIPRGATATQKHKIGTTARLSSSFYYCCILLYIIFLANVHCSA